MSALGSRIKRLWRATHTFVSAQDERILADYWKEPLDDANVKAEDFKAECNELRRALMDIDIGGGEELGERIRRLADKNLLAYYAFMYQNSVLLSRQHTRGYWVTNNAEGFLKILHDARLKAARKERG